MRSTRILVLFGLMAGLIGSLFIVSAASAQDLPEGAECSSYDVDPPAALIYSGATVDVVIGTFDDGSTASYFDVTVGDPLQAPEGRHFVSALKCNLPEPTPEPTPVPPEPTPVPPEPTPVPPEPTPVPPQPTPEPETEVLGVQEEQGEEELAETGVESAWLAVIGIAFIAGGALLVGTAVNRRNHI